MPIRVKYYGKADPTRSPEPAPLGSYDLDGLPPLDGSGSFDFSSGRMVPRRPDQSPLLPAQRPQAPGAVPQGVGFQIAPGDSSHPCVVWDEDANAWVPGPAPDSLPAAEHAGAILYWVPADSTTNPPTPAHWQPMDDAATSNWGSGQLLVWDDVQKKWKFSFTPWSGANNGQILYWHSSDRNWHLSQPLTAAGQVLLWSPGNDHDQPEFVRCDTAELTVVTAEQYDTTNHVLQVKTRKVRVLLVPGEAESAWTTIAGGQAETYP